MQFRFYMYTHYVHMNTVCMNMLYVHTGINFTLSLVREDLYKYTEKYKS